MSNYIVAYYGGTQPSSKEEGMAQMEKWKAWVQGLGEAMVNPGTPMMETTIVTSSDVQAEQDPNAMKGFSIIQAPSIEDAVAIAQSDPFLDQGGTIRVSKLMEM